MYQPKNRENTRICSLCYRAISPTGNQRAGRATGRDCTFPDSCRILNIKEVPTNGIGPSRRSHHFPDGRKVTGTPERQALDDLQRVQILSPTHSLLNSVRHLRHFRFLRSLRRGVLSNARFCWDFIILCSRKLTSHRLHPTNQYRTSTARRERQPFPHSPHPRNRGS